MTFTNSKPLWFHSISLILKSSFELHVVFTNADCAQASNGEAERFHLVGERLPVPSEEDRHLFSLDFSLHLPHVQHLVLELLPLTSSKQSKETRGGLNSSAKTQNPNQLEQSNI